MISFAAVAQFAPVVLGGIFWKGGTRAGALCGLDSPDSRSGSTRCCCLRWRDPAGCRSACSSRARSASSCSSRCSCSACRASTRSRHAMIWSMIANIGAYVGVSLSIAPNADEHRQASVFVDVFQQTGEAGGARFWRGTASAPDLYNLLARFLGVATADAAFREYATARGRRWPGDALTADAELVHYVEVQLAGAIGAASARVMVASVVKEEALTIDEVREILDEASQIVVYSHRLRAEIARARSGDRGAARGQRAAEGARPAQGRLRLDSEPRVAHATDVDPRLHSNPARRPGDRTRAAQEIPRHHHQGDRAADAAHQPGARPVQIESGKAEWRSRGGHEGGHRRHADRDGVRCSRSGTSRSEAQLPERVSRHHGRPRPNDPGDAQPAFERRQILRRGKGAIEISLSEQDGSLRIDVRDNGPGIEPGAPSGDLRQVPPGRRYAHRQAARQRTRPAYQPQDRRAFRRPVVGRKQPSVAARASRSRCRPEAAARGA